MMKTVSQDNSPLVALVGTPNCGKTALFNLLTGARQKVANYAGVTIERKEGSFASSPAHLWRLLDLPGVYSLSPLTPDEIITHRVLEGSQKGETQPNLVICVVDASNLSLGLRLALEIKALSIPMIVALNMADVAKKQGIHINLAALSDALEVPVVETVAVKQKGAVDLIEALDQQHAALVQKEKLASPIQSTSLEEKQKAVQEILAKCVQISPTAKSHFTEKLDRVVLHPFWGVILLAALMFTIFQAVFSWAAWPMDLVKNSVDGLAQWLQIHLPEGAFRSLLTEGILGGAGNVLVFLPQILILFFFILVLEDSGYLPRAAFLLDRLMGSVGLSGRSFIPLLSSFACAIPGVMATRTIPNPRDRLITIMIAPLMTCSARIPVYTLLISAFVPNKSFLTIFNLQGVILFCLYLVGIFSAAAVAFVLKKIRRSTQEQSLLMELPLYHWPNLRNLGIGLLERAKIFLTRIGTLVLALMVLIWFLSSFPKPPENATEPAIYYSIAGMIGRGLEFVLGSIGFNWQICIALVPGMAAREVAVGTLGTVYALSQTGEELSSSLAPLLAHSWSLGTAFSLLAWYVFAPQCLSTLSAVKRETNSWSYPLIMAGYMMGLAYVSAFITWHVSKSLGLG